MKYRENVKILFRFIPLASKGFPLYLLGGMLGGKGGTHGGQR
jgi:hypothetical protein